MRIKRLETFATQYVAFVRVTADDGAVGWGQLSTYHSDITALVFHRQLAPHVLGADISTIDAPTLLALGNRVCEKEHKFPGSYLKRAIGGLDTALWDLAGKRAGKPVVALLGGTPGPLRAYASSMRRDITPAQEAERFTRLRGEFGFDAFKFRVGAEYGHDVDEWPGRTEEIVPTIRRALGPDAALLVDGNSAFSPARAIQVGRLLEAEGVEHFEEPCLYWELEETRRVTEALDVAVNKLQWTKGSDTRRIVFLVGDAPPHMDYAQDTKYPTTLAVAKQKDILVNAVLAGNARDTERVWRDIAQNGNGRFIPIPQDGGQVVIIETPYDEDIIILQREINGTVIPYGSRALQKRTEDKTRQLSQVAAAAPAQASEMAAYLNKRAKRSSEAVTGDGDLVSDVKAGRTSFSTIKEDDLPENLRAMKPERRMDEVDRQMNQRKALNEKLGALVAKRDKFVAEAQAKAPPKASSFDRVVEDTLKAQIKR